MGPPTALTHHRIPAVDGGPPSRSLTYDQFDVRESLGRGGTATVHRAVVDDGPPGEVAIKRPQLASGDTVTVGDVEAVVTEAERWAGIDGHPHVATVFDRGTEPVPWIAVEYLAGGPLADRVASFDPEQAVWTAIAVADAVQHAHHRGVAHLDVTPSNVLLATTASDRWDVPKVVDWGLAKPLAEDRNVQGFSPAYAAPEQFRSTRFGSPGPSTDIYQVGAVLYELLTGVVPHERATDPVERKARTTPAPPTDRDPSLPSAVDDVLLPALAPAPEDRYRTAAQFMDACIDLFERLIGSGQGVDETTGSSVASGSNGGDSGSALASSAAGVTGPAPPGYGVADRAGPVHRGTDADDATSDGPAPTPESSLAGQAGSAFPGYGVAGDGAPEDTGTDEHGTTGAREASDTAANRPATDGEDTDRHGATTLLPAAHAPRSLAADLRTVRRSAARDALSIEAALTDLSGFAGQDALDARLETVRERGADTV